MLVSNVYLLTVRPFETPSQDIIYGCVHADLSFTDQVNAFLYVQRNWCDFWSELLKYLRCKDDHLNFPGRKAFGQMHVFGL